MAEMMAKGISAALFPPEVGLCIAIPGLLMVHLLKRKRDEYDAFLAKLESFTVQMHKKHGAEFVRKQYIKVPQPPIANLPGQQSFNPA